MRLVELVNDLTRWWSFRKHDVCYILMEQQQQKQKRQQEQFQLNASKMKCLDIEIIMIRAIVAIISLSGCIWHLADISTIYFSYETNVNVRFEHEVPVRVPGVTICTNASLTIREDYMLERYPQLRATLQDDKVRGLYNLTNSVVVYVFSVTPVCIIANL